MVEGGMKNGKTALLTVVQDPFHNWFWGTFVIFAQQIPGLWQNSAITHSKSARQTESNLTYSEALLIFRSCWKPRMYSSWSSHFAKSWRESMFKAIVLPKGKKLQSLRKAEWRSRDMTSLCELRNVIQFIQSPQLILTTGSWPEWTPCGMIRMGRTVTFSLGKYHKVDRRIVITSSHKTAIS